MLTELSSTWYSSEVNVVVNAWKSVEFERALDHPHVKPLLLVDDTKFCLKLRSEPGDSLEKLLNDNH